MNDKHQAFPGEPDLSAVTDAVGDCDFCEEEGGLSADTDAVEESKSCRLENKLVYQEFDRLFVQISQETSNIWQQKRLRHQLFLEMTNSGLIWKENVPYYEDALQEQWEFFFSNLCESRTGTQYDRTRSNVMTWFNYYLRRRLQTFRQKIQQERSRINTSESFSENGEAIDPVANIPAPDRTDFVEQAQLFAKITNWIETNPNGVLNEFIRGRPDLTCQVILRMSLSELNFANLAKEFSCPYHTLYSFYNRKCRTKLRKFLEDSEF
ncbi:MAG: hypothetical protein ACRC62_34765 [Microcoleus sp.]